MSTAARRPIHHRTAASSSSHSSRPSNPAPPPPRDSASRTTTTSWTHVQVPVGEYDPSFKIMHPKNAQHVSDLRGALERLPALRLTISATPNCTELRNHGRVRVAPSMLKDADPTGRAWEAGNLSRKVGKTFMQDGTDIKARIHEGMAVINVPECPADDPMLIGRAVASLSEFVKRQEDRGRRDPAATFSDRGPDGKFMIFYNHRRSDEMEQGPDGKYRHVQYSDAPAPPPKTHVNVHYGPSISNVIAALPRATADFVVMYLKGLAELFECAADEIMGWSLMLLDYCADGGFSSHIDGIRGFNNQAGFVVLLSLSDVEDQPKSLDLIPISTLSRDRPIRITTKGRESILMTGLARVDEPHSIPFNNRRGGRTLAIKMPFVRSTAPYVRMLRSQLSGVEVQLFDVAEALKAGKGSAALSATAREFMPSLSASA